jgi:hypothetical protein
VGIVFGVLRTEHAQAGKSKGAGPLLAEIVNGAGPTQRQRQSQTYDGGFIACSAYLCQQGGCFKQYHSNNSTK